MKFDGTSLVNAIEKFAGLKIEEMFIVNGKAMGNNSAVAGWFRVDRNFPPMKLRIVELSQSLRFMAGDEVEVELENDFIKFKSGKEGRDTSFGIKVTLLEKVTIPEFPSRESMKREFPNTFDKAVKLCYAITSEDPTLQYLSNIYTLGSHMYAANDFSVCRFDIGVRLPQAAFPYHAVDILLKSDLKKCHWGILEDDAISLDDSVAVWKFAPPAYDNQLPVRMQSFFEMEGKVQFSIPKFDDMETIFSIQQSLYTKQGIDKEVAFFIQDKRLHAVCFDGSQWVVDSFDVPIKVKKDICFVVSPDLVKHSFSGGSTEINVVLSDEEDKILLTSGAFQQLIALRKGDVEKYARLLHG